MVLSLLISEQRVERGRERDRGRRAGKDQRHLSFSALGFPLHCFYSEKVRERDREREVVCVWSCGGVLKVIYKGGVFETGRLFLKKCSST